MAFLDRKEDDSMISRESRVDLVAAAHLPQANSRCLGEGLGTRLSRAVSCP